MSTKATTTSLAISGPTNCTPFFYMHTYMFCRKKGMALQWMILQERNLVLKEQLFLFWQASINIQPYLGKCTETFDLSAASASSTDNSTNNTFLNKVL